MTPVRGAEQLGFGEVDLHHVEGLIPLTQWAVVDDRRARLDSNVAAGVGAATGELEPLLFGVVGERHDEGATGVSIRWVH